MLHQIKLVSQIETIQGGRLHSAIRGQKTVIEQSVCGRCVHNITIMHCINSSHGQMYKRGRVDIDIRKWINSPVGDYWGNSPRSLFKVYNSFFFVSKWTIVENKERQSQNLRYISLSCQLNLKNEMLIGKQLTFRSQKIISNINQKCCL